MQGRIILFKIKDIVNGCAPKRINTLGIVAHNKQVFAAALVFYKQTQNRILQIVGILKLIHVDVLKLLAVFFQHLIGVIAEKPEQLKQQIVKVQRARTLATRHVFFINIYQIRAFGRTVFFHHFSLIAVQFRRNQVAFGQRNARTNGRSIVHIGIQAHFFNDRTNQTRCIIRIVNCKIGRIANFGGFSAQNTGKNSVKSTRPHLLRLRSHHLLDAVLHFAGRFIGKGER